ncbi:hypothetical protein [Granulicella paludicola]|uniref:hypothetical protein n=1 Tax=Granulicella paludicola TaxID=474951 RepID=UPI0021E098D7|nr:hypothetical protein [Granulicella paludicola]
MRSLRLAAFLLTFAALTASFAQTPLRNMPGPQGGTIVYGTVDGANTPPAAMGVILKSLHQRYGERPQVGRVFRVRGTDSDAVFFTLTPHNPGMGKVAGMLLTSNASGHVEAALLTDESARFGKSINPMLQSLFAVWKPASKSSSATGGHSAEAASGPVAQLRPYRLQDNSASMMLAEGWRVAQGSGGGTILAQGPHGEVVALGFPYLAHNSNDPRTGQAMAFGRSAAGRNTIYAKSLVAPYGADLGRTLVELNNQALRNGSPAVTPLQIAQQQPVRSSGARCAILSGTSSSNGQSLQFEGSFCQSQMDGSGSFMNLANLAFAPPEVASRERATLRAMLGSFQVNQAVVNAQAGALAGPVIEAIHQIGRDVDARIAATHQQEDEQRASFEQHNDVMDRQSQAFSNYILDKSVLLDTETGGHVTAWNTTAQTIVNSNPQRYEYVDTPNYWKGIDY